MSQKAIIEVKEYAVFSVEIPNSNPPASRKCTTIDLCILAVNQPPPNGFGKAEIKRRNRILEVLFKAQKSRPDSGADYWVFNMDVPDFRQLREIINKAVWTTMHADLVDFFDSIDAIQAN